MTDAIAPAVVVMIVMPVLAAIAALVMPSPDGVSAVNRLMAGITVGAVAIASIGVLTVPAHTHEQFGLTLDAAAVPFLIATGFVGFMSALLSPIYLRVERSTLFEGAHSFRWYYPLLHLFWAALLVLPLIPNLAIAWIVIEATTATSAVLVAFSGRRRALEAGWKYLILTSLGLTLTLFGMLMVYAAAPVAEDLSFFDWSNLAAVSADIDPQIMTTAFVLVLLGLAAKIGWAPVHHWLPDAHSEAPPPISMLLSAALLPTIILVAWRTKDALEPGLPTNFGNHCFLVLGLLSLAVSIPFLLQPLPWKRFLAYSSLEHMGIIALGIGFGSTLAIAGACLHVVAHALAKWLGFHTVIPLMGVQPSISRGLPQGITSNSPGTASAVGISLYSLAGLPPSPIFVSELLILIGGIRAGYAPVVGIAAFLLTVAFLGLAQAGIHAIAGPPSDEAPQTEYARTNVHTGIASCIVVVGSTGLLAVTAFLIPLGVITDIARGIA